eukprot:scaffold4787_cov183-Amphora_coffeaeformis.AAC.1
MVGRAAGGVLWEEGRVEGSRAGCEGGGQGSREGVQVAAPVEGVNVGHHGCVLKEEEEEEETVRRPIPSRQMERYMRGDGLWSDTKDIRLLKKRDFIFAVRETLV